MKSKVQSRKQAERTTLALWMNVVQESGRGDARAPREVAACRRDQK